jgi:hypothetical protein
MIGSYTPTRSDEVVRVEVNNTGDVQRVLLELRDGTVSRCLPALVLESGGGSALTIAQAGSGVCLVWMPNEALSFHTIVGGVVAPGVNGETVSYSYYGQVTEVPSQYVVSFDLALRAVTAFFDTGAPGVPYLQWEQD